MKIKWITGGSGFIGSALTQSLTTRGHELSVLSRNPDSVANICGTNVKALGNLADITVNDHYDVIINLAGAPIFGARWTEARKKILIHV